MKKCSRSGEVNFIKCTSEMTGFCSLYLVVGVGRRRSGSRCRRGSDDFNFLFHRLGADTFRLLQKKKQKNLKLRKTAAAVRRM